MIQVTDLVKSFEQTKALDGLNLSVPKAAVYGLVGPNGAGKSTLIRHLTGIYRQDAGEIRIDGEPVFENPAVKEKIAYIPDEIPYWSQSTVDDMRRFYEAVYPRFDRAYYDALSKQFALDGKQMMRKLSKGEQKLAAFHFALAQRPEIVILDEPVDGLDPVNRRKVWSLLLDDVAERGVTVLVSSHNLRELEDVCDHVGIMNRGRMLLERSLSELQENIVKIQLVLPEDKSLPEGLEILHQSMSGRLQQLILRGKAEELTERLAASEPIYQDVLPLTLEEIFIYELGGTEHEFKNFVL
ncbi:MAG: ABC transporter ATP-binding protein [Oscillospiraceae bacterium]|nr:ABC transporter ATP-binding protein [Oscillospiraceae bacterium]